MPSTVFSCQNWRTSQPFKSLFIRQPVPLLDHSWFSFSLFYIPLEIQRVEWHIVLKICMCQCLLQEQIDDPVLRSHCDLLDEAKLFILKYCYTLSWWLRRTSKDDLVLLFLSLSVSSVLFFHSTTLYLPHHWGPSRPLCHGRSIWLPLKGLVWPASRRFQVPHLSKCLKEKWYTAITSTNPWKMHPTLGIFPSWKSP